ncbi:MAG: hypothetical protein Q8P24_07105 [Desulfobacterales bacterium]|nr:hypothetical protein [Desulfobacterales bacterium]
MCSPGGLIAFPEFAGPFRSFGARKGAHSPASARLFIDYLTAPLIILSGSEDSPHQRALLQKKPILTTQTMVAEKSEEKRRCIR